MIPSTGRRLHVFSSCSDVGVTYVGDVKMAALATRAFVAAHGDDYLCPLSAVQILHLLELPADLFESLGHRIADTSFKMSEP
jgi:hypothetical protein